MIPDLGRNNPRIRPAMEKAIFGEIGQAVAARFWPLVNRSGDFYPGCTRRPVLYQRTIATLL
jgi:hypothetical protein